MVELSSLGVKKSPQQVNFIVAAVDNLQQLLQRVFLVVVVLAALVVVFWLVTGSYLAYRTSERDKLITQVNQVVASLEATRDFERRFIVTRDKLELYGEINTNEKMVDLFPRLSALVPYGVRRRLCAERARKRIPLIVLLSIRYGDAGLYVYY